MNIRPMPLQFGVGFCSNEPIPEDQVQGYRYECVGRNHNYHVTAENQRWPYHLKQDDAFKETDRIIDGFSPNLNKELHVGHLRQLALARALQGLHCHANMVAILGASLGVKKAAIAGWEKWTTFVGYHPKVYYDVLLPYDVVESRPAEADEIKLTDEGIPEVWDGPKGPVLTKRADGRFLYAHYDLAFAKEVGPTHYITGHEQKDHFASLGLAERHFPMGLVLGLDGKKMKSRDGSGLLASEAMEMVKEKFRETPEPDKLAWNVLCWNLLHVSRDRDLRFDPESWTKPESPGLYITYTVARVKKALEAEINRRLQDSEWTAALSDNKYQFFKYDPATAKECDYKLIGLSQQSHYWIDRSVEKLDPAGFANHLYDLAIALNEAYTQERILEGRDTFLYALDQTVSDLSVYMYELGMFEIDEV